MYECSAFLTVAVQSGAVLFMAVVQVGATLRMTFLFPLTF
jgi:hypothetical protein